MTIKKLAIVTLCIMIAGCTPIQVQDKQIERQIIDIYDNQRTVKEHVIIKDDQITIYDKEWKTKGYGKAQK